ncbi:MAG TPA: hypothetical protein PLJ35_06715 [Anaerolineae bacterium]|nr:hypothetical protein [Anaerolineae bacterium]HOQ98498.1 hypothetical protein [Anaerolineae bacterium]HPL28317.1 hypothetical protein [Anaerolineae bacterium]
MGKPSALFTDDLLIIAKKSFVGGCFGCLGAGTMGIVVFFVVFVIFPTQFVALVKTIQLPILPQLAPAVTATPAAAQLPAIEIWISSDGACSSARITQLKLPIQQQLFVCARNPQGVEVRFTVQVTLPSGRVSPVGADLATKASGEAFSIGIWSELPSAPGVYRVDALIGSTIVGSTVLTVVS